MPLVISQRQMARTMPHQTHTYDGARDIHGTSAAQQLVAVRHSSLFPQAVRLVATSTIIQGAQLPPCVPSSRLEPHSTRRMSSDRSSERRKTCVNIPRDPWRFSWDHTLSRHPRSHCRAACLNMHGSALTSTAHNSELHAQGSFHPPITRPHACHKHSPTTRSPTYRSNPWRHLAKHVDAITRRSRFSFCVSGLATLVHQDRLRHIPDQLVQGRISMWPSLALLSSACLALRSTLQTRRYMSRLFRCR